MGRGGPDRHAHQRHVVPGDRPHTVHRLQLSLGRHQRAGAQPSVQGVLLHCDAARR